MKNSLRIHKWTHNEFNIFILGVLTHPPFFISITTNALIHNFLPNLLSSVTHEPVAVFTANRGD